MLTCAARRGPRLRDDEPHGFSAEKERCVTRQTGANHQSATRRPRLLHHFHQYCATGTCTPCSAACCSPAPHAPRCARALCGLIRAITRASRLCLRTRWFRPARFPVKAPQQTATNRSLNPPARPSNRRTPKTQCRKIVTSRPKCAPLIRALSPSRVSRCHSPTDTSKSNPGTSTTSGNPPPDGWRFSKRTLRLNLLRAIVD